MIETEPVRYTRAAIVSRHEEEIVTVVMHYIGLILGHGAK
jgi:hypothetical protein